MAHLVGIKNVINIAKDLGIQSNLSSNLSLALGSSEVSLLNLTSAYAGFLNLGHKVYPRGWLDLRLKSNYEVLIKSTKHSDTRVIGIEESKALIKMLVAVVESGTGTQAYINGWNLAGKTGTSQNSRDAWFVGFTSQYVVGVWMGSDDNKPLKGVVGGNLPSKIWSDIIKKIHTNEGMKVQENQILMELSSPSLSFKINQTIGELSLAKIKINNALQSFVANPAIVASSVASATTTAVASTAASGFFSALA